MGRKNLANTHGRWANIIIFKDKVSGQVEYIHRLNLKGELINKFKSKKHDRTADHNHYLANSSSDNLFPPSHFLPSNINLNSGMRAEETLQNISNQPNNKPSILALHKSEESSDVSIPSSPQSPPPLFSNACINDFDGFFNINYSSDFSDDEGYFF